MNAHHNMARQAPTHCALYQRGANGALMPLQGGTLCPSMNIHVQIALPAQFDYCMLPLVIRRQSAEQSGSTQHGFVSTRHYGDRIYFSGEPNGGYSHSASITLELWQDVSCSGARACVGADSCVGVGAGPGVDAGTRATM